MVSIEVRPDDFGRLETDLRERLEAAVAAEVDKVITYILLTMEERGPKLTGWFRGSIVPYVGPISDFRPARNLPFYPLHGEDAVARVMSEFKLGQEAGVVSNAPHAKRLAFGWSSQAPTGWLDVIAMEAAAL